MQVRDLINLYEEDELVTTTTELIFWNGTERVELEIEGIDGNVGRSGAVVLMDKHRYDELMKPS